MQIRHREKERGKEEVWVGSAPGCRAAPEKELQSKDYLLEDSAVGQE